MLQKIDDLKEPPVVGQEYLVPCIIKGRDKYQDPNPDWIVGPTGELKLEETYRTSPLVIYPIINHLHHDKENGQNYYHYHIDYRFIELKGLGGAYHPIPKQKGRNHVYAPSVRYNLLDADDKDYKITYHAFKCLRQQQYATAGFVQLSKIEGDCHAHNNKCPHKGYDLSQVVPDQDGVVTCPLHGLQFKNKRLWKYGRQF